MVGKGSSTPATANTENVYTMGKVATGIDPGTSPTAQLTVEGASDLKGNTTIEGSTTLQKDLIVGATGSSGTKAKFWYRKE